MSKITNTIDKLKKRWGITNTFQVIVILIVFACSGFTVLFLEEKILHLLEVPAERAWWMGALIFVFLTMPLYNLLLLIYGFILGQFTFFWRFEKDFFGRMLNPYRKRKSKDK